MSVWMCIPPYRCMSVCEGIHIKTNITYSLTDVSLYVYPFIMLTSRLFTCVCVVFPCVDVYDSEVTAGAITAMKQADLIHQVYYYYYHSSTSSSTNTTN